MSLVKHVLSIALSVLACALLVGCLLLLLLTLALISTQVAVALRAAPVALAVTHALPAAIAFRWVLPSPLGGVFRTDFVLVAAVLLIAAKLVRKVAKKL